MVVGFVLKTTQNLLREVAWIDVNVVTKMNLKYYTILLQRDPYQIAIFPAMNRL